MRCVILAAGDGGRLRPFTLHTPKALLQVGGRPLIHQTVLALLAVGIEEIGVVVGHDAHKIVSALGGDSFDVSLQFIENPDWEGGNAISLHAARFFAGEEPFILCMGDHIVSPEILAAMVATDGNANVLGVDSQAWHPSQLDDATRVLVGPENGVVDIGKDLAVWNAVDIGVFKLGGKVIEAIEHLRLKQGTDVEMSDVVRLLGEWDQPFATCDIAGLFWADIDTVEDYRAVDRLMVERAKGDG